MSYSAKYEGKIDILLLGKDQERKIRGILQESPVNGLVHKDGDINFTGSVRDYDREEVMETLGKIAEIAKITKGTISFTGEDGALWRLVYADGWEEQTGDVYYRPENAPDYDELYTILLKVVEYLTTGEVSFEEIQAALNYAGCSRKAVEALGLGYLYKED